MKHEPLFRPRSDQKFIKVAMTKGLQQNIHHVKYIKTITNGKGKEV